MVVQSNIGTPIENGPRLFFLAGKFDRTYSMRILKGLSTVAARRGSPVIAFELTDGVTTFDWESWRAAFAGTFDAAAVLATGAGAVVGSENLIAKVIEPLRGTPLVTISRKIPNVPATISDSRNGIAAAVDHLVTHHGYKRIAFIKGPPGNDEAERRFEGYKEGLARNGIPFDGSLVADGAFSPVMGKKAAQLLWEERRCGFDAVIAANDSSALGAEEYLRSKRLVSGRNYALIGHADSEAARHNAVPLSTVRMKIEELGESAAHQLIEMLAGNTPADITLQSDLIIRKSCGCFNAVAQNRSDAEYDDRHAWKESVRTGMLAALGRSMLSETAIYAGLDSALTALSCGLSSDQEEKVFLEAMHAMFSAEIRSGGDITAWYQALAVISGNLSPKFFEERSMRTIERAVAQVHGYIGEKILSHQVGTGATLRTELGSIRWLTRTLNAARSEADIAAALKGGTGYLTIDSGLIARFPAPIPSSGCAETAAVIATWGNAPALPEGALPVGRIITESAAQSVLIIPLAVSGTTFGFGAFSITYRESLTYDILADAIAAALKRIAGG
ncbi:MAG: substrate-binding domain-containing protein [Spirochaetota bacterium]